MKNIALLLLIARFLYGQFTIELKYKIPKCGGKKNPDTTSYFLLKNKKFIVQYSSNKIDTIITDALGKIKLPDKKGKYYLYEPWKFYKTAPPEFPLQFYNKTCLTKEWKKPDFIITIISSKKYRIQPQYLIPYCIDKHPCLRTDTALPHVLHR